MRSVGFYMYTYTTGAAYKQPIGIGGPIHRNACKSLVELDTMGLLHACTNRRL